MKKTSSIYNNTFILQSNLTKVKRGFNLKEIKMRKAAFHNLGCKVNSYETEAMQQLLRLCRSGKERMFILSTRVP